MQKTPKRPQTSKKPPKRTGTWTLIGVLCIAALLGLSSRAWQKDPASDAITFPAKSGPLVVSVLEGGNIHALESQIIRCEVEGRDGTKILSIVEEGYRVSEEDVADAKVLVELDSSHVRERLLNQETDVQASLVNLTEQVKFKEVRENQSLSDLKAGNLKKKFALMDFKKYLGEAAAELILEQVDINEESVNRMILKNQAATLSASGSIDGDAFVRAEATGDANDLTGGAPDSRLLLPEIKDYDVDFSIFANVDNEHLLGNGEASQQLRKFKDDLLIAEAELAIKKKAYAGAQRLHSEGYMTPNELDEKKIAFDKSQNTVKAAHANLELFKNYDLQKNAEQYLLNYEQALLELARQKSDAIAELSDALSDVEWGRRRYNHELEQLKDLQEQLTKCVIRAERPGLVVYGDGRERWGRKIREGATVWERQAIITIPDMREMALTVRIHESQVKRIETGQIARIVMDAEPDKSLTGVVYKVGLLPDSEDQRFNPDQKVYKTVITVNERENWIKPGMTAQAEIIVREFDEVLYVPLQAVFPRNDGHACLVQTEKGHELRPVQVLDYNNSYCAVESGLTVGEQVFLHVPKGIDPDELKGTPSDFDGAPALPAQPVAAQVSP